MQTFSQLDLFQIPSLPLAQKANLPKCSAIYFALDSNNNVLYIGKAINLFFRWRNHHRFDQLSHINRTNSVRIGWWECSPESELLTKAEKLYIKVYKPLLNNSIVPIIPKGDFSVVISKLAKNIVVLGLFKRSYGYEMKIGYAWPEHNASRKIGQLIKHCQNSFTWEKEYIQTSPVWTGTYNKSQTPQQIKLYISPCVTSGLFWDECTKASIKVLVAGVLVRAVDWRSHYSIPDEDNFLDLTELDELIG
ncbi:XRE family transcriptional regulator [Calothrix sp. NIES-2100]|uniref:GIY-YIG nuclease family protein n=1 Tax=Calothrix sp. NIES-2100 TaxID=1954172 RepID=UPI000B5E7205|nr:XRE family transcriptional regulator [Calothrix sp. NIES-2100]